MPVGLSTIATFLSSMEEKTWRISWSWIPYGINGNARNCSGVETLSSMGVLVVTMGAISIDLLVVAVRVAANGVTAQASHRV